MSAHETVKLAALASGGGGAAKIPAEDLRRALDALPRRSDPNILVGHETGDDAAVYRLDGERALVETLDFFPPVVDDPFQFGRVAAANAFSDVYAMGGRPLFALNILCFPMKALGHEVLARVLAGGDSVAAEAGVAVIGGHSVEDDVPKYGMVVTGLVHPDRVLQNTGAKPGDALFLTKPLGSGILTTALKKGKLTDARAERVIDVMSALNKSAAEAMMEVGVNACTDVTGFGLAGHLREMLAKTGIGAEIDAGALPLLDGVRETLDAGICPGGTHRNLEFFGTWMDFDDAVAQWQRLVLADAQTSGGLMIACPPERADALTAALTAGGALATARIGTFVEDPDERIRVRA